MTASRSGLYLLNIINSVGLPTKIHHSLGSIIDFHIGKDMLLIELIFNLMKNCVLVSTDIDFFIRSTVILLF